MSIRSDVRHFVLIHIYNLLLPHSYHNKIYRYDAVPSSHVPPFWHGTLPQSSWLISQLVPRNPVGQVQLYPPNLCWHTPLFKHGEGVQKSTVVLQVGPVQMQLFNNVIQGMWKFPIKSIIYWVIFRPLKNSGQLQAKSLARSWQVPLFSHGMLMQSSIFISHLLPEF